MTTVDSLPPEVLHHIIRSLGHPPSYSTHLPYRSHDSAGNTYTDLRSAALVCRRWRQPAQLVLWDEVHISSLKSVASFVQATRETGRRTSYLHLKCHENYCGGEKGTRSVIGVCTGLKRLRIVECKNVVGVLRMPELQGLEELDIVTTGYQLATDDLDIPPFAFALTHLRFSGGSGSGGVPSMAPFLRTLLQPSLTTLSLTNSPYAHDLHLYSLLSSSFAAIAPNLTTLELQGVPAALPFLRLCTSLIHFLADVPAYLDLLPVAIASFTCSAKPTRESLAQVLKALRAETVGVSKLRVLEWTALTWAKAKPKYAWKDLVEECRERAVKLVYEGSELPLRQTR